MKKLILAGLFAAASVSPALADAEAACEAYAAENGGDASGCACLGEAAAADAELAAALEAISSPEDLEAADDSTKDAIRACYPDADV